MTTLLADRGDIDYVGVLKDDISLILHLPRLNLCMFDTHEPISIDNPIRAGDTWLYIIFGISCMALT